MKDNKSFIEVQFPVSKVSKECFKERKAVQSQTLTGLGKWWGRKPLFLVRAALIGCLLPAGEDPQKDREIFMRILAMDDDGLKARKRSISTKELYSIASNDPKLKNKVSQWFVIEGDKVQFNDEVAKENVENYVFKSLSYDEKLKYCCRPEELGNIRSESWNEINSYLGTNAHNISDFISQISEKRYGHNVRVGDCFCGGGSIPFEANRIGADAYGSDLNPVAGLLTWADINFSAMNETEQEKLVSFQKKVYAKVDQDIREIGFETSEQGDRGDAYLYCIETTCPECGARVPMSPTWLIGVGSKTVAILEPNEKSCDIHVKMNATKKEMDEAKASGTVRNNELICPCCGKTTPISSLRRDRTDDDGNTISGLRRWEKTDFTSRSNDVFSERLYAIRYASSDGKRYYKEPDSYDLNNEKKIIDYLCEHFEEWQHDGIVPSSLIESGYNTDQPIRERGWAYWHQLFNPRQIILHGLIAMEITKLATTKEEIVCGILSLNRCCNWNSKLCSWGVGQARESMAQTFYNQAFNTMWNHGSKGLSLLSGTYYLNFGNFPTGIENKSEVKICDARDVSFDADIWMTDPPYADAVNYHELTEFFLAWDKGLLRKAFSDWYGDSKRILAVRGDENFSQTMIDIYMNLAKHMDKDGMQVVMFTHSDPAVWAQLAIIMWKSGLNVTAAWNIATETDAVGHDGGNYVKGTALLILRKQVGTDIAFLDEINADIRTEVKRQIASMQELDDKEEPNFSDPDFVLAAYAASLKVLTSYAEIEDLDLDYELNQAISNPSGSKIVSIIENAKKIAYDCVIPMEFDSFLWRELTNAEKFYIKGLESEKHGNYQISTYQEFARGFSITGYAQLMASERANNARLKTPFEMAGRTVSDVTDFEKSLMRSVFHAIYAGIKEDMDPNKALGFLKNDIQDYWGKREMIKQVLVFLIDIKNISNMHPHWTESAEMAEQLFALVSHDSI